LEERIQFAIIIANDDDGCELLEEIIYLYIYIDR
jgi:hypothetical protein